MMDWQGKQVLVTGAGGFIGSHLAEALVRQGANVRALIRYNSAGRRGHLEGLDADVADAIEVVASTVEDPSAVERAVAGCDTVWHLAALIGIPYSYVAPRHYVATNIEGTVNILEACARHDVRRLVHTSTSETYGTALFSPITEDHPLQGQSPYSASKIAADQMALAWYRSFELPVAIMRPFNTFGPRQSARAIIPTIMTQLLSGPESVVVGNLASQRDMNFVADTVAGFLAIAQCDAAIGEVVHVGSGQTQSMGELAERILTLFDREVPIRQASERVRPDNSEVMLLLADNSKAERLFGYAPTVGLDEGLRRTWAWLQDNPGHYRPDRYAV